MTAINKFFFIGVVLLFSMGACNKVELPEPTTEDPVFGITAAIGGMERSFVAGEEDYYMFTSFREDDLGVTSFIGRFEKLDFCIDDCTERLEIEIRASDVNANNPGIDRSLAVREYPFRGQVIQDSILVGYDVFFENRSQSDFQSNYIWTFGDGNTSSLENPPPVFYPVNSNDNEEVMLESFAENGNFPCYSVVTKSIVFQQNPTNTCSLSYLISADSFNMVTEICGQMEGVPPYSYTWNFDNMTFNDTCIVDVSFNDTLFLGLIGTDAVGCTQDINITLINDFQAGSVASCSADFSYQVRESYSSGGTVDSLNLSQVTIRYTSPEGILYTSDFPNQPPSNFFLINEVSDYEANENGEKTKLLEVEFSCALSNVDGDQLIMEGARGTIAVAYP